MDVAGECAMKNDRRAAARTAAEAPESGAAAPAATVPAAVASLGGDR